VSLISTSTSKKPTRLTLEGQSGDYFTVERLIVRQDKIDFWDVFGLLMKSEADRRAKGAQRVRCFWIILDFSTPELLRAFTKQIVYLSDLRRRQNRQHNTNMNPRSYNHVERPESEAQQPPGS
jgi:hypothetical protein